MLISLVFRPTQPFLYTAIPHRFAHGNALQNSPLETTSSSLPSSDWENLGGNYILRPPSDVAVRAVIHFLGGAFVGAAPHVTYRYLLHGFAQQGYLVVTTPYRLGFDYLEVCDSVLECFERAAVPLAKQYGALPVVGMGHSCGALLQVYITCLFPDTPRAANALISFNNKPVKEAIPVFEEVVVPVASTVMADTREGRQLRESLASGRKVLVDGIEYITESSPFPDSTVTELRQDVQAGIDLIDQLPGLLRMIAEGAVEFSPTPDETRESCRRMYSARRTLLLKFENDAIDESDDLEAVIQEAKDIMRLKRPMVNFDIRFETISGTHITPLTQDIMLPISAPFESLDSLRDVARENFLRTVDGTRKILVDWLSEVV